MASDPAEPSGASSPPGGGGSRGGSSWPEWLKRIAQTANNIISLERAVAQLQLDNVDIKRDIDEIRRTQEVQAKQIEMLSDFIRLALDERVKLIAENAAYRVLIGKQGSHGSDETGQK
jgi:hypothetical protein